MEKRERLCEDESQDEMRSIPDEVLVSILSLLNFKEATASRRVARRWRYLHRWTRKLDFDGTESIYNLKDIYKSKDPLIKISSREFEQKYKDLRCKYIRWVESFVANHKSPILEEFRILYDISHKDLIDSWIQFATSRKVEKLELNLAPYHRPVYHEHKPYTFRYKNGSEFIFLRTLCTNHVGVSGEVVVSLLRNCPLLEHLSVSHSLDLLSLEIINTFPSFKRLEIYRCFKLESVVIRDSNLVFLNIVLGVSLSEVPQFVVRNVPLLTEIWTTDISVKLFSTILPQIEILKLYLTYQFPDRDEAGDEFRRLGVEMSNLKQFVILDANQIEKPSLLHLVNFIKSSHGLQRFVLEAPVFEDGSNASKENIPIPLPFPRKGRMQQYPCLKEVKLVVNAYVSRQFELLMHFVETGVALQNIVVDPYLRISSPHGFLSVWDYTRQSKASNKTLEMAHALQSILPSTINLTIL